MAAPSPPPSAPSSSQPGGPLPPGTLPPQGVPALPATGSAPPAPVLLPPDWEPRRTADLLILDALAGQARHVEVAVGTTTGVGPLEVSVPVCLSRPATEARDDAALLVVKEKGSPLFQGWMFSAEPALGTLEHPIYDIRLTACR